MSKRRKLSKTAKIDYATYLGVILAFAVVDVAGMVLFATGAMWFANGQPLFVPGFPTGVLTAGASLVGGLLLMFWAASRILRELLRHPGGKDGEPDRK